ncbi:hypothetical protein Tco_1099363 [Tanacetum coccineum]
MTPHHVDWTVLNTMGCAETIEEMLEFKVIEMGGNEEVFSSETWRRAFDIKEPIYNELCHEFFSTFEFDEEVTREELTTKKIINAKVREGGFEVYFQGGLCNNDYFDANEYWIRISSKDQLCFSRSATHTIRSLILRVLQVITYGLCQRTTMYYKRKGTSIQEGSQIVYGQFVTKLAKKLHLSTDDLFEGLRASILCRSMDFTTLKELICLDGRLIADDPSPGVLRFAIPRPPRPTLQDLFDGMGRMEIRQGVLEHMSRRQSYHSDRYYSVVLSTWLGIMECPWMETMHPRL